MLSTSSRDCVPAPRNPAGRDRRRRRHRGGSPLRDHARHTAALGCLPLRHLSGQRGRCGDPGRSRRAAKSSASDIASISFIGPHPACWFSVGFKARSLSKAVREADEDLTNIRPANCARICARMVTFLPTQCERNQSTISRDLPWKTLTI